MFNRPVLLATLLMIGLSMHDNGKPPKIPLFQYKATTDVAREQRPEDGF